jgi:hypothetical protein
MEHLPQYAIAISLAKKPFQNVYVHGTPASVPPTKPNALMYKSLPYKTHGAVGAESKPVPAF